MKKQIVIFLIFANLLAMAEITHINQTTHVWPQNEKASLSAFTDACLSKPELPTDFQQPVVSWAKFDRILTRTTQQMNAQYQSTPWLGKKPAQVNLETAPDFKPFVQKVTVPANSKIIIFGDLHGSVHGFVKSLEQLKKDGIIDDQFKIMKNDTYILFLGDYVDRGKYGVEVIYTLLKLKDANPDHVFLARGNHEDVAINGSDFGRELAAKFKDENYKKLHRFYDLLPVAIYLGTGKNYLQCCHGGMEVGYTPQELLASEKQQIMQAIDIYKRPENIKKISQKLQTAIHNCCPYESYATDIQPTTFNTGFMWNDFVVDEGQASVDYNPGRGWIYGKELTNAVLAQTESPTARVCGVFRAHQHWGPMLEIMNKNGGKASLWNGLVETFYSCPAIYQNLGQKAMCWQLTTAKEYKNWHLKKAV